MSFIGIALSLSKFSLPSDLDKNRLDAKSRGTLLKLTILATKNVHRPPLASNPRPPRKLPVATPRNENS